MGVTTRVGSPSSGEEESSDKPVRSALVLSTYFCGLPHTGRSPGRVSSRPSSLGSEEREGLFINRPETGFSFLKDCFFLFLLCAGLVSNVNYLL